MSKNLTTNGFARLEPVMLSAKASHIVEQMTLNGSVFKTPNPTLAELTAGIDELDAAIAAAETGDYIKIAIRDDKKSAMVDLLQLEGTYVNNRANGDRTIALLSGFDVRKEDEPRNLQPITTAPTVKRLADATSVQASVKSQTASKGVNWFFTSEATKPLSDWTKLENRRSKIVFDNLVPGREYTIVAELLGPREQSQLSPRATVIA